MSVSVGYQLTKLYYEIEEFMGGECVCGGKALECNELFGEQCCGEEEAYECQKETLTKLKEVLEDYEMLKATEEYHSELSTELKTKIDWFNLVAIKEIREISNERQSTKNGRPNKRNRLYKLIKASRRIMG